MHFSPYIRQRLGHLKKPFAAWALSSKSSKESQLFNYTAGRWLWNEEKQLLDRFRAFNIDQLKRVACKAVGATDCLSIEKIGEGDFNKVFRLLMQDGQRVIAKIPNPNAGPPRYTTASEVATMDFCRTILDIPVPRVLGWSSTSENSIEAEHILKDEAQGTPLNEAWDDMSTRLQRDTIWEIVDIEKKLLSIPFDRYGSIFFKHTDVSVAQSIKIISDVAQETKDDIERRFAIGPSVQRELWAKERTNMSKHHGPRTNTTLTYSYKNVANFLLLGMAPSDYLKSLAGCEVDWLSKYASGNGELCHPFLHASTDQRSPQAHIDLLEKVISIIPLITPKDNGIVSARLWHPDFHAGNIFIGKDGKITSIIDWQGALIGPIFISANPPKVLDYSIDLLMELPDKYEELDEDEKAKLRHQVSQSILIDAYETRSASENPLMYRLMRYPNSKTLKEIIAFVSGSWEHGLIPLRYALIRIQRDREDLSTEETWPYDFGPEEITQHQTDGGVYNDSADFWSFMSEICSFDGYVPNEDYPNVVKALRSLRDTGMGELKGEERDEFDKMTQWIRDLK